MDKRTDWDWQWDWQQWASQGPAHRQVWAFLTLDLQQDLGAVATLLTQIEQLMASPHGPAFSRTGNAYHLQCDRQGVTLTTLMVEAPDQHIDLPTFKAALTAWKQHIQSQP